MAEVNVGVAQAYGPRVARSMYVCTSGALEAPGYILGVDIKLTTWHFSSCQLICMLRDQ